MFAKLSLILLLIASLLLSACASSTANNNTPAMDQSMMAIDPNQPFDAQFIDSMLPHHQSALAMASEALTNAEHPELKQLAEGIITTQSKEISGMQAWRKAWYPDLKTISTSSMNMGEMKISNDASKSFDQRFLESMISHHQGALEMAKMSDQMAEHAEIKTLSDAILKTQQAEIEQMQGWLKAWFG